MTAPASDPDGTDPRILSPSDDDPIVTIAHGHSTGKTYHTTECPVVKRMDAPNEVAQSVAEWKGYSKCKRCDEQEGGDGYPRPGRAYGDDAPNRPHRLARTECLQIRVLLLTGGSRRSVADAVDVGGGSVDRHRTGACSCDHDAHALTYDHDTGSYRIADDDGSGLPTQPTGRTPINAATCADLRDTLTRDGVAAAPLARLFGVTESPARRHATGECTHDHDTPPVAYDHDAQQWTRVTDSASVTADASPTSAEPEVGDD